MVVTIVERWNQITKTRADLFGFADLRLIKESQLSMLERVTSTGWAARLLKVNEEPRVALAPSCGSSIQIHNWCKLASRKNERTPKIIPITLEDL